MVGALRQNAPILSVASYRTWLASRPDEEHWELIEGVPMMMTPRNRRHQRIASNLELLLNAALKRHDPMFVAYRDIGVNIVSIVEQRTAEGWRSQVLHADDELTAPEFGLTCSVRDICRDTPLG